MNQELELLSLVDEASSVLSKRTLRRLALDVSTNLCRALVPRDGGIRFYEQETLRLNERLLSGDISASDFSSTAATLLKELNEHAARIAQPNDVPLYLHNHFSFLLDTSPQGTTQQLKQDVHMYTQERIDELHKALERSRK